MAVNLKNPIYQDETKACEHLEALRWPDGAYCPRCGGFEVVKLGGKAADLGQYNCRDCRKKFTVTVGTVFERSHIPLTKWLLGFQLMTSSKKGMSAHQLHRMLDVTYKTAWFMAHRIREAMAPGKDQKGPLGGKGKYVEADTTYIGGKEKNKHVGKLNSKNIGGMGKQIVHALVERGGCVRSDHIANISGKTLRPVVMTQVDRKSTLMTDTAGGCMKMGKEFARHEMVDHGTLEYVRGDAHSNTVEGYFSILKRGVTGVYHHVSEAQLKRYLAEFDFCYNERAALGVSDKEHCDKALQGITGKRLTYRSPNGTARA